MSQNRVMASLTSVQFDISEVNIDIRRLNDKYDADERSLALLDASAPDARLKRQVYADSIRKYNEDLGKLERMKTDFQRTNSPAPAVSSCTPVKQPTQQRISPRTTPNKRPTSDPRSGTPPKKLASNPSTLKPCTPKPLRTIPPSQIPHPSFPESRQST